KACTRQGPKTPIPPRAEAHRRAAVALLCWKCLGRGSKVRSGCFGHTDQTDACRADANLFVNAGNDGPHALQVRIPAATPGVVGVADHVSIMRPFAADITLQCHIDSCTPK